MKSIEILCMVRARKAAVAKPPARQPAKRAASPPVAARSAGQPPAPKRQRRQVGQGRLASEPEAPSEDEDDDAEEDEVDGEDADGDEDECEDANEDEGEEDSEDDYTEVAVGAAALEARYGKVEHGHGGWGRRKNGGTHRTFAQIRRKEAAIAKRAGPSAKGVARTPVVPTEAATRAVPTKPAAQKAAPKKAAAKASCAASPSKLSARQLQEETLREVSLA